jgi:hypothetical protein
LSLHFIEQMAPLLDAADEAEWFGAIAGLAETWGFDRLLIAMLPRPTIRLEDAYVRSTYSPTWRRTYDEQGLVHIDPTVRALRDARHAADLVAGYFHYSAAAFHVRRSPRAWVARRRDIADSWTEPGSRHDVLRQ